MAELKASIAGTAGKSPPATIRGDSTSLTPGSHRNQNCHSYRCGLVRYSRLGLIMSDLRFHHLYFDLNVNVETDA